MFKVKRHFEVQRTNRNLCRLCQYHLIDLLWPDKPISPLANFIFMCADGSKACQNYGYQIRNTVGRIISSFEFPEN